MVKAEVTQDSTVHVLQKASAPAPHTSSLAPAPVLWSVSDAQEPYTSIREVVSQASAEPDIQLIFADCELSDTEAQVMASGWIEI